jgi:hypothetical protein
LKNSVLSETSIAITHKLSSILEAANELFRARNLVEAMQITETRLHHLTKAKFGKVFVIKDNKIMHYNQEYSRYDEFPTSTGIAGHALSIRKTLSIPDMYSDPYYNSIVDLITTFPVVVMPIFDE